jgi:hypothetical protein
MLERQEKPSPHRQHKLTKPWRKKNSMMRVVHADDHARFGYHQTWVLAHKVKTTMDEDKSLISKEEKATKLSAGKEDMF